MQRKIIIATRGSELALWQAHFVQKELERIGVSSELLILKTQGDNIQHLSFDKLEGKGFFTKEIEEAVLSGAADLAVHSHKDLPTELPEGLAVAAVSYREDPRELLLIRNESVDKRNKFFLKQEALVGTSSARRKSLLKGFRPDVKIADLRGNVPTRIQKLRDGQYDAILLAAAGVSRLGLDLSDLHVEELPAHEFIPAPAQGVLALQTRDNDHELIAALQQIHHPDVQACIAVERRILNLLEGGCHLPLGAYCEEDDGNFKVWTALAASADEVPRMICLESRQPDELPERVLRRLRSIVPARVSITRDLRKGDVFSHLLEASGCKVSGVALIDTKRVQLVKVPEASWVFFSSKHAVRHFFAQAKLPEGARIAAVGKGTSDELRKFNHRADFIGGGNDTSLTAKQFASRCGRDRVLFPQAKGSLRTVQQQLPAAQIINLTVYETIERPASELPDADVLVITSPSNAEAYFSTRKLLKGQEIVAMGHATQSALRELGITRCTLPATFDDAGLAQAVFAVLSREKQD
jgi:hydroxymethylbilane synthase